MSELRLFVCEPYGARLTPRSCGLRYAPQQGRRGVGAGPRADRVHCHACEVGKAHARGDDAPGVEYSARPIPSSSAHREPATTVASSRGTDVSSGRPTPQTGDALGSNAGSNHGVTARRDERPTTTEAPVTEKTYAPIRCAHPGCHTEFTPTHSRSLYCDAHRNPEAAAERKRLRDELNDAVERSLVDPRAKTEPPTATAPAPDAPTQPETPSDEHESDEVVRQRSHDSAAAWAERRRVRAAAGWVSDLEVHHTELAKASADEVLEEDEEHGEKWVPWRWLLDHRTQALRGLRNVVRSTKEAVGEAWTKDRQLAEAVTAKCAFLEQQAEQEHEANVHAARVGTDVEQALREELRSANERLGAFIQAEDRLQRAMLALIEVECACRDDLDADAVSAEWDALDAGGVERRARELIEFVIALRGRRFETRVQELATRESDFALKLLAGLGAARVLRAVGYRVETVEAPRGTVLVVEGAGG